MGNTRINNIKNFVMSPLFVELMDETGGNILDLDYCLALKIARFDLEVTFFNMAAIIIRDQSKYHFI